MSEILNYLDLLSCRLNLTQEQSCRAFQIALLGGATPVQVAALLTGMRVKGETIDELTGAALALKSRAGKIETLNNVIDICGTGSKRTNFLNISTAVGILTASCGVTVAKHGNRSFYSHTSSADVFAALGVNIDATREIVESCMKTANICFMMAQKFHGAIKNIAPIKQEVGFSSVLDLIGPLCNPAMPKYYLLGVFTQEWRETLAKVLHNLGVNHAWIVHSEDGFDEISIFAPTYISELKNGQINSFSITPEDAGLQTHDDIGELHGAEAEYNARKIYDLICGHTTSGPFYDMVLLNTAAALLVSEQVADLKQGVIMAKAVLEAGKAKETLMKLIECSNNREFL